MNFRLLLITVIFILFPQMAKAYVIPAFPVHQAFPLPKHPTPTSIEEAQILISAKDDKILVTSQLVLLAKYATAITLEMSSKEIKDLSIKSGNESLEINMVPSGCNGGPSTSAANSRGNCHYEAIVRLPAGVPVTVTSRYQLKGHSGDSASSLYGDTLPTTFGSSEDEKTLSTIGKQITNYALSLKGLNRWAQQPKRFRAKIKGPELLSIIRDLSPSGWIIKGQEATWVWQSNIDALPAIDIAWQTVKATSAPEELAIYARLKNSSLSNNNKSQHIMALKRFHATSQQYQLALDQVYKQSAQQAMDTSPANDIRIVIIPEIIANKVATSGQAKAQAIVQKYLQIIEEIQESLLLEGQDLGPSNEAIGIIKQLTKVQPNFIDIN